MAPVEELDTILDNILKNPLNADLSKLDNFTVKEIRLRGSKHAERLQTNNQAASIVSVVILITS